MLHAARNKHGPQPPATALGAVYLAPMAVIRYTTAPCDGTVLDNERQRRPAGLVAWACIYYSSPLGIPTTRVYTQVLEYPKFRADHDQNESVLDWVLSAGRDWTGWRQQCLAAAVIF